MPYALAVDIGASSGRHILGKYVDGKLETIEVYRFENGFKKDADGTLYWDIKELTSSVIEGIKKCSEIGKIPTTVAIDTWGVDYVLLDNNLNEILPVVAYRDERTAKIPEELDSIISFEELYSRTGIQRVPYNTVYQLYCDVKSGKLEGAKHLLMMPEYLSYKLCGVMKSEYTIASTTALLNAKEKNWDVDIIKKLGINPGIFKEVCQPGTYLGNFTDEVKKYVGFDAKVVFAPSHDTASAVAACDLRGHSMYISSGTWSLIGAVNSYPVLTKEAMMANFTNEGGVNGTYRFLKNIMGMWLFQNIRKILDKKYSYNEMMNMAMDSDYTEIFDPNDPSLLSPENMIDAIRHCLGTSYLPLGDILNSVYYSLATSYKKAVKEIEAITGEEIDSICIVGGGSKDAYLNELTQKFTGKPVITGITEATAAGNLKTQLDFINKL